MASWPKWILMAASPLALAVTAGLGEAHAASDDGCTLSPRTCAKEGFVIVGPTADQLVAWRKDTDFYQIRVDRAQRFLDRAGAKQTFTLLLSGDDLASGELDALIEEIIARDGSVIVIKPSFDDADRLDELSDHEGGRWNEQDAAHLYGVRKPSGDDGRRHEMAFVLFTESGKGRLNDDETAWLVDRIGRQPPVIVRTTAPKAIDKTQCDTDPRSCINKRAQTTHNSTKDTKNEDTFEVDNYIYGARSFRNRADYYYVQQELKFEEGRCNAFREGLSGTVGNTPALEISSTLDDRPHSATLTTTVTAGVDIGVEGQAGYSPDGGGFDVAPSLSYSASQSTTVVPTDVTNETLNTGPGKGTTQWVFGTIPGSPGTDATYNTGWIWVVDLSSYTSDREPFSFTSEVGMATDGCNPDDFSKTLTSMVDQPFPTEAISFPLVIGVSENPVAAGKTFQINGNSFYPSLVERVLLGFNAVPSSNISKTSDTVITVTAPNDPSRFPFNTPLAVEVTTSRGSSNTNETVTITD